MDVLPEVADVLSGKMPVLMDGGIRRGADVFKALAAGADAVCVGRPYLFGLAAAGQPGVEKSLRILQAEFERSLQYAGTPSIENISARSIWI
jgi:isopentenyl diphosphate isomerase/L-lactate dehydrogenase-like FMN-dependent dehydrogenase